MSCRRPKERSVASCLSSDGRGIPSLSYHGYGKGSALSIYISIPILASVGKRWVSTSTVFPTVDCDVNGILFVFICATDRYARKKAKTRNCWGIVRYHDATVPYCVPKTNKCRSGNVNFHRLRIPRSTNAFRNIYHEGQKIVTNHTNVSPRDREEG